jgi:flavin reductase (DIM6/NTAB) family NADH-FMN oxidoreductase RutF
MTEQDKQAIAAINQITYGLYVVSSKHDNRINAQIANSMFQITNTPRKVALGINKQNYTYELINASQVLTVNILRQDQLPYVRHFGLQSGRKVDKFARVRFEPGTLGCPILPDALAYLECRVSGSQCVDCGTHMLLVCDVVAGNVLNPGEPLTYDYYRKNRG